MYPNDKVEYSNTCTDEKRLLRQLIAQIQSSGNLPEDLISQLLQQLRQQTAELIEAAKLEVTELCQYAIGDVYTIKRIRAAVKQFNELNVSHLPKTHLTLVK